MPFLQKTSLPYYGPVDVPNASKCFPFFFYLSNTKGEKTFRSIRRVNWTAAYTPVKPAERCEALGQNFDNTFAKISKCNLITVSAITFRGRIIITQRNVIPGLKFFPFAGSIIFKRVFPCRYLLQHSRHYFLSDVATKADVVASRWRYFFTYKNNSAKCFLLFFFFFFFVWLSVRAITRESANEIPQVVSRNYITLLSLSLLIYITIN